MEDINYVMRIMANGGLLLADDTCKETVRRWKEIREGVVNKFKYRLPFDWIIFTAMWFTTTTTSDMH